MKNLVVLLIVALALAACAPTTGQLERITPLPAEESTNTPAPTVTAASPVPASATPTLTITAAAADATPTPLSNDMAAGSAREIAAATDVGLQLTPRSRLDFDSFPVSITFDEFYDGYNMRTGLILSDKLLSLDGQQVTIEGYMAPPLKPRLDFFVLTRIRLAFCPFCSTAADWPDDIALVYLDPESTTTATQDPIRVTGRIEIGLSVDQETGMVNLVRIYADDMEIIS